MYRTMTVGKTIFWLCLMIDLMPGFVFGLTDNGLLILGAATGVGIERYFRKDPASAGPCGDQALATFLATFWEVYSTQPCTT